MDEKTPDILRAISFARQNLSNALLYFLEGQTQSVTSSQDFRDAKEAVDLLHYLKRLGAILMPLTGAVSELESTCAEWLSGKTTRLRGDSAREALSKVIKTVERVEDKLKEHLKEGPPGCDLAGARGIQGFRA